MMSTPAGNPDLPEWIRNGKIAALRRYTKVKDDLTNALASGYVLTEQHVKAVKIAETRFGLWSSLSEGASLEDLSKRADALVDQLYRESSESGSSSLLANALHAVERDAKREWVDEVRRLVEYNS